MRWCRDRFVLARWAGAHPSLASRVGGTELCWTLALLQVGTTPDWVGPTVAISLAVMALSFLGMAIAVAVAAFGWPARSKKVGTLVDGLQDDIARTLKGVRSLTEQAQEVMVLVRHETGAFAQTARRLRRKTVRAVDRIEAKLEDLETLYDVVHDEIEGTARWTSPPRCGPCAGATACWAGCAGCWCRAADGLPPPRARPGGRGARACWCCRSRRMPGPPAPTSISANRFSPTCPIFRPR